MNVSSTTALTRELNPLEALFLPSDDPWFLWLKYQILIYLEDRLKTIHAFVDSNPVHGNFYCCLVTSFGR